MNEEEKEFWNRVGTETEKEELKRRFGIKVVKQKVTAKRRRLKATWTFEKAEELREIYPPIRTRPKR